MKRIAAVNASMGTMSNIWDDGKVYTYSKYLLFKAIPCKSTSLGLRNLGLEIVSHCFSRSLPAQRDKEDIKDKGE